jgi:hypothetical protein
MTGIGPQKLDEAIKAGRRATQFLRQRQRSLTMVGNETISRNGKYQQARPIPAVHSGSGRVLKDFACPALPSTDNRGS